MDTAPDSEVTIVERRRRIFEDTVARYAASGISLDDPAYLDLIQQWISGAKTMRHVIGEWQAHRFSLLRGMDSFASVKEMPYPSAMTTAELLAEVDTAAGDWTETGASGTSQIEHG